MQSQNSFFDDLAKVLNGLAGTMAGVGREAEAGARERAKEWFGGLDFVSREEFDAVKEMAAKARSEADALKKRVEELEKAKKPAARRKTAKPATTSRSAAKKPAPKKPATKKTVRKRKPSA